MSLSSPQKRKAPPSKPPKNKRARRAQEAYHSSSSSSAASSSDNDEPSIPSARNSPSAFSSSSNSHSNSNLGSDADSISAPASPRSPSPTSTSTKTPKRTRTKRHSPPTFAQALTTILSTPLPTKSASDPVLARSKPAKDASSALADDALTKKAQRHLRAERKALLERGRVKDVLMGEAAAPRIAGNGVAVEKRGHKAGEGLNGAEGRGSGNGWLGVDGGKDGEGEAEGGTASRIAAEEKKYRKTAQRGVVKLFNAVRAAQERGEEARRRERERRSGGGGAGGVGGVMGNGGMAKEGGKKGTVGEMGREEFLELVGGGGGGK